MVKEGSYNPRFKKCKENKYRIIEGWYKTNKKGV